MTLHERILSAFDYDDDFTTSQLCSRLGISRNSLNNPLSELVREDFLFTRVIDEVTHYFKNRNMRYGPMMFMVHSQPWNNTFTLRK